MAMHMCWPRASQPAQPFPSCHRCWSRAAHTAARRSYGGACAMPSTPSGCAAVSRDSEATRGSRTCRQSGPPPAARIRSTFCRASRATSRATGTIGRRVLYGGGAAAFDKGWADIRALSCHSAGVGQQPEPTPTAQAPSPSPRLRPSQPAPCGLAVACGRLQRRRQPHVSSPQPRVP